MFSISFRKHSNEKKGKQLVNSDDHNVNFFAYAIITSTARASSVFLSNFSINLLTAIAYADWLCYSLFKQ